MPLPEIHDGREMRKLGCLPRLASPGSVFPLLADKIGLIPRDKWQAMTASEIDLAIASVRRIIDQNGIGMCASAASTQGMEEARRREGLRDVRLSPGDLYRRVSGGRDAGSSLSDNLTEVTQRGIAPDALVPDLEWRRSYPGSGKQALAYRGIDAFDCPSFDAMATAVQRGFPVVYGIMIGGDFSPGSDLWLPDYSRGGGGHAMLGVGLCQKADRWGLLTVNSWASSWGKRGCAVLPESYFTSTPFTDGWALRSTVVPDDDPVPEPQ